MLEEGLNEAATYSVLRSTNPSVESRNVTESNGNKEVSFCFLNEHLNLLVLQVRPQLIFSSYIILEIFQNEHIL